MFRKYAGAVCICIVSTLMQFPAGGSRGEEVQPPYLIVLGIAQDGGVPQAGDRNHKGWTDAAFHKMVSCLAIVDPGTKQRWVIDCTPDFREQLHMLDEIAPADSKPGLAGIFLSHAHIGHYAGLMHLGLEVMGAEGVPVYVMPRMHRFLKRNGPWSQLVKYKNISLRPLQNGKEVELTPGIRIAPFIVPHRQEYSEVVGFYINGPDRTALYISDIDSWEEFEEMGMRIEDLVARVDVAYLDGTFYDFGEIPGRDMSSFPHPFIAHTMDRFKSFPVKERRKIRFIHLNHTNPALIEDSEARKMIEENGFNVAHEGERIEL